MRYFIGQNGRRSGPFTEQQVRDQLSAGQLGRDDLVWREGMTDWLPAHLLFHETPLPTPPPIPSADARTPRSIPSDPGRTSETPPKLASREVRLLATSIDHLFAIVLGLPGLIQIYRGLIQLAESVLLHPESPPDVDQFLGQISAAILSALPFLLPPLIALALVQLALLALRGQTLGKLICKIRIVLTNGSPAGFAHTVLLRVVAMGFITAIPVVGWLISCLDPLFIFRDDRRCLHDLVAGTTVIDA